LKRRILLVDDEPNVLQSIRRMLHGMRDEWELKFAHSGPEALDLLTREPSDVIVTDMRMPKMDGAQLLTEVKNRYPHMVRIVLSGHSDQEMILRSVQPAHQYLSKPADEKTLKTTINRACVLRGLLSQDTLKGVISRLDSLPSLPALYAEIIEELQSPNASIQKIGQIIARDPAMAAKVLQLVNSAFFALPRRITDPTQAVSLLGIDIIKALVLTAEVFSAFDKNKVDAFDIERLWEHSFLTGGLAKRIATAEDGDKQMIDDAYMAGLLHDIGKLVLVNSYPEQYNQVLALERNEHLILAEAEHRILGAGHGEVGAYLLSLWGLPDPIIEAVVFHHRPGLCQANTFIPLAAVHIADALQYDDNNADHDTGEKPARMDLEYLAELNLLERVKIWRDEYNLRVSGRKNP